MEGNIQNAVFNCANITIVIHKACWIDELQKDCQEPHENPLKWGLHKIKSVKIVHETSCITDKFYQNSSVTLQYDYYDQGLTQQNCPHINWIKIVEVIKCFPTNYSV